MTADQLLQEIREENRSGATHLTRMGKEFLTLEINSCRSCAELRRRLPVSGKLLISAQPAMASIFNLVNTILLRVQGEEELERLREMAEGAASEFLSRMEASNRAVADAASDLIGEDQTIVTHSFSSAVAASIIAAHRRGRRFTIIATESRPVYEGRELALMLAKEGIRVKLVADAAIFRHLNVAQAVMVGADTVTPSTLINKAGTYGLALAAWELNIPLYVLAGSEKFHPSGASFVEEPKPPQEIWGQRHPNLEIFNYYFDQTPLKYITALISEGGILKRETLPTRLKGSPLAPELLD